LPEQLGITLHLRAVAIATTGRGEERVGGGAEVAQDQFNELLFETVIRVNVRLKEAPHCDNDLPVRPGLSGSKGSHGTRHELIRRRIGGMGVARNSASRITHIPTAQVPGRRQMIPNLGVLGS